MVGGRVVPWSLTGRLWFGVAVGDQRKRPDQRSAPGRLYDETFEASELGSLEPC
jgi:hypothetical protein